MIRQLNGHPQTVPWFFICIVIVDEMGRHCCTDRSRNVDDTIRTGYKFCYWNWCSFQDSDIWRFLVWLFLVLCLLKSPRLLRLLLMLHVCGWVLFGGIWTRIVETACCSLYLQLINGQRYVPARRGRQIYFNHEFCRSKQILPEYLHSPQPRVLNLSVYFLGCFNYVFSGKIISVYILGKWRNGTHSSVK